MSIEPKDAVFSAGAARVLELTTAGVHYLERTGQLHAIRVNGVRLFRLAEVEALALARRERQIEHPQEAA